MRTGFLSFALALAMHAIAQLDLPVPLQLTGPSPAQRQVTGLADPAMSHAGVSVDAARTNHTTFTTVNGTATLIGDLNPAPGAYAAGMSISIVPTEANMAGASIDLNGLGSVPVVKLGGIPLDSAELFVGTPYRMVFDGQQFQLLTSTYLPCPAGYHVAAREYCIEDSSRAPVNFSDAGIACMARGGRLCTLSEWSHACLSEPGFLSTVLNFEWVDHAANNTSNAKRIGSGSDGSSATDLGIGCQHGQHALWSALTRYRCCFTR